MSEERLLKAVGSQSSFFDYPWRYALSLFEPGPLEVDMGLLWQRNGRNLIGGQRMGMRWGASATEHLASQIEKRERSLDLNRLQIALEIGAFMRSENAAFLKGIAGHNPELLQAAERFERSANCFRSGFDLLSMGTVAEIQAIVKWLREIAAAEREAGGIFLAIEGDVAI